MLPEPGRDLTGRVFSDVDLLAIELRGGFVVPDLRFAWRPRNNVKKGEGEAQAGPEMGRFGSAEHQESRRRGEHPHVPLPSARWVRAAVEAATARTNHRRRQPAAAIRSSRRFSTQTQAHLEDFPHANVHLGKRGNVGVAAAGLAARDRFRLLRLLRLLSFFERLFRGLFVGLASKLRSSPDERGKTGAGRGVRNGIFEADDGRPQAGGGRTEQGSDGSSTKQARRKPQRDAPSSTERLRRRPWSRLRGFCRQDRDGRASRGAY